MRRSLVLLVSTVLTGLLAGAVTIATPAAARDRGRAIRVTSRARPNPLTAGDPVLISGRVFGPQHADVVVGLWRRLPGQRHYHRTLRTVTNADGHYRIPIGAEVVQTNERWFVRARRRRSRPHKLSVRAIVTLTASDINPTIGDQVTLSGAVSPSHAGQRILLEQLASGHWRTIASQRLSAASQF